MAREAALLTSPRHNNSDAENFYAGLHATDSLSPPQVRVRFRVGVRVRPLPAPVLSPGG